MTFQFPRFTQQAVGADDSSDSVLSKAIHVRYSWHITPGPGLEVGMTENRWTHTFQVSVFDYDPTVSDHFFLIGGIDEFTTLEEATEKVKSLLAEGEAIRSRLKPAEIYESVDGIVRKVSP